MLREDEKVESRVKDNNNETGRKRKSWHFYEGVNEVPGCKPATLPTCC